MMWKVTGFTAKQDDGTLSKNVRISPADFRAAVQSLEKAGIVSIATRDKKYRVRLGSNPPSGISDREIRVLNALLGFETPEERHPWIVRSETLCGGAPVLAMTRVPVDAIVSLYDAGQGPEQIIQAFPHLTPFHVDRALYFHFDRSVARAST